MGGLRAVHHGTHKIPATSPRAASTLQFPLRGFRRPSPRAWRGSASRKASRPMPSAFSVLAQAGEGSVRDSLSALDQAIACCGAKLDARRSARAAGRLFRSSLWNRSPRRWWRTIRARMLEVVDELERNGHNLQHLQPRGWRLPSATLLSRAFPAPIRAWWPASRRRTPEAGGDRFPILRRRPQPLPCSSRSICSAICSFPCNRASTWKSASSAWASRPLAAHRRGAGATERTWSRPPIPPARPAAPPPRPAHRLSRSTAPRRPEAPRARRRSP